MSDSTQWLTQLRQWVERQANDDDPGEQLALGIQELLQTVPDYEICEAYHTTSGDGGDPLSDVLAAECERRNLDF